MYTDENNKLPLTGISKAATIEEISEFWDTHSLADYWDETEEVAFEVRATPRRRVALDANIYDKLAAQAKARGILPETLANLWLAEKLQQA